MRPEYLAVDNVSTRQRVASRVRVASTWRERMVGLLDRGRLEEGEGLLLPRCRAVHTIGMRFGIDVIFLDRTGRVVKVSPGMRPHRLSSVVWGAAAVMEVASGQLARTPVSVGDQLAVTR